jgi:CRP-like cAMP-binding protein
MVAVEILKGFELFNGLDEDSLVKIAKLCHLSTMHEGNRIFAENTGAKVMHLCRSGKVDLLFWVGQPLNRNISIHRAGVGEVFGWSALIAPYIYTASAECVETGEEIRLNGSELLTFFSQNPQIGYKFMENLGASISLRLSQTRQKLVAEWLGSAWPANTSSWGESDNK